MITATDQDAGLPGWLTDGRRLSSGRKGIGVVAGHLLARAATLVVTGVAGAAVFDRLKAPATGRAVRRGAVAVTAAALAGKRRVETGAENLRLSAGDIAAEAREKIGEQARPPAADAGHHDHDH